MAEFIGYIKSNWSAHSRVDQRRRCLRQLVSKVSAVVDAAEELERLAWAGGGLDMFTSLDAARTAATEDDMDVDGDAATEDDNDMDVDGRPRAPGARHRQEGRRGRSCAYTGLLPSPGAKRKRAYDGGEVDTVQPQKRRLLAWMRSYQLLPFGSGRVSASAPRQPALPRSRHAPRTVALAMSKIRRRIGKPTTTRHRPPQPNLGHHFSRITL